MRTKRIAMLLGLFALATSMHAQSLVRATVPFDFRVGSQALPTGKYEISSTDSLNNQVLLVRNVNGQGAFALVAVKSEDNTGKTKLMFHRYGKDYFLAGVVVRSVKYDLPTSKAEKRRPQHAMLRTEVIAQAR